MGLEEDLVNNGIKQDRSDNRPKGFTMDQLENDGFDVCRRVDGIYLVKGKEEYLFDKSTGLCTPHQSGRYGTNE